MLKDFRISLEEDSVLWKGGGHGKYGVKVAYNVLACYQCMHLSD